MVDSDQVPPSQVFNFNGVDPDGNYLITPVCADQLMEIALQEFDETDEIQQESVTSLSDVKRSVHYGFDAPLYDPSEAGWGVIVHQNLSNQSESEIEKLVRHRADHNKIEPKVFEVSGELDYQKFLSDNSVSPGYGEVEKVPYYLLIAGDPTEIPYRFQYELGTEYAVGRLAFSDHTGYQAYIDQLIDYETAKTVPTRPNAVFWGTANPDDDATQLSARHLVQPLNEKLESNMDFPVDLFLGDTDGKAASKENLITELSGSRPPALLFTASHGMGFNKLDKTNQPRYQGALVTQGWEPGDAITRSLIYSGDDILEGVNVRGMVHFAFACFGAGTPSHDDFSHNKIGLSPVIAPFPFVSNLANQELIHGSLAFVGHVDRAWGFSFIGLTGESQILGFERALKNMLLQKRAWPIGHCLRDISDRALHLSKSLLEDLNEMNFGKKISSVVIADKWKERNDARAYALIGDPAVSLRVADMNKA
jgi:hypothetical protein